MEILDNLNVIKQRDPEDALGVVGAQFEQLTWEAVIENTADYGDFVPANVVLGGMGGSALGGLIARDWLELEIPFVVTRDYELPNFVDEKSLVICVSVSGNTEETLATLTDAQKRGAKIVIIASGGKLLEIAEAQNIPFIRLEKISQPRYGVFMHLRAITKILNQFGLAVERYEELAAQQTAVKDFISGITANVVAEQNPAKKLAFECVGKTPVVFSSSKFASVAYKWKISFNENAKNVAFWNELPEFSHNEFIGWTSHPIEKPFAIIDLRSEFDNPRISLRFELTEKLLSGQRPAVKTVNLHGDNALCQMLCGVAFGDFVSIYLGLLNGVDPTPVKLVEKLKVELNQVSM
ncbi:MAG: bifunctional phosphoglucose/phosphomannose isomerase [Candidatus Nomurabacteria bacterium]|jgi:glucose/mannose-6-phosphate isomerase|nr:bifunctional phosphoglucose/phosphomannose isomerase [Candidatus Nomurabacteria bacterium]